MGRHNCHDDLEPEELPDCHSPLVPASDREVGFSVLSYFIVLLEFLCPFAYVDELFLCLIFRS